MIRLTFGFKSSYENIFYRLRGGSAVDSKEVRDRRLLVYSVCDSALVNSGYTWSEDKRHVGIVN